MFHDHPVYCLKLVRWCAAFRFSLRVVTAQFFDRPTVWCVRANCPVYFVNSWALGWSRDPGSWMISACDILLSIVTHDQLNQMMAANNRAIYMYFASQHKKNSLSCIDLQEQLGLQDDDILYLLNSSWLQLCDYYIVITSLVPVLRWLLLPIIVNLFLHYTHIIFTNYYEHIAAYVYVFIITCSLTGMLQLLHYYYPLLRHFSYRILLLPISSPQNLQMYVMGAFCARTQKVPIAGKAAGGRVCVCAPCRAAPRPTGASLSYMLCWESSSSALHLSYRSCCSAHISTVMRPRRCPAWGPPLFRRGLWYCGSGYNAADGPG